MATPTVREVLTGFALYTDPTHAVTVTTGASTAVGDWLVGIYSLDYGTSDQVASPSPGTWADWGTSSRTGGAAPHLRIWARKVMTTDYTDGQTSGPVTVSIAHTNQYADAGLVLLVIAGANPNAPLSQLTINLGSHATAHVAPSFQPIETDELQVSAWISGPQANDVGNYAPATGMTEVAEVDMPPYSTLAVDTQALTSNAATGTKTATFTRSTSPSTATGYSSVSFGLRGIPQESTKTTDSPLSIASTWSVSRETTRGYDSPMELGSVSGRSKEASVTTDSPMELGDAWAEGKDITVLPAGGPINLSVWAVTEDGYVPLPDATQIDLSPVVNDAGSVSISYPETGLNFVTLHQMITQDRDLEIAIWVGGRDEGALRATLTDAHGDEVDEQAVWTFSGTFLESRMAEAIVWPAEIIVVTDTVVQLDPKTGQPKVDPDTGEQVTVTTSTELNPNQETIFENATAGKIMGELMAAAHARGALLDIDANSFGAVAGSNGARFTNTATMKIAAGTDYVSVLGSLVDIGMCDWEITGDHRLRIYEANTRGRDLTETYPPIVLRAGKDLTDSPRTYSTRDTATYLLLAGKDGLQAEVNDDIAQTRRGRRIESYRGVGNIADQGTLQAYGQADLASRATGKMELSHGLTFAEGGPVPVADFDRYDWVWSDQGWGLERLRVAQWNIRQDQHGNLSGSAQLNDLTSDWEATLARRLAALEQIEVVVGTPAPSPPPANNYRYPARPTGLVASSLTYQDLGPPVGNYASVTAGWAGVVLNADGSALTVTPYYRVRYRYVDGPGAGSSQQWPGGPNGWQYDPGDTDDWVAAAETGPNITQGSFSGVSPGRNIEIQVATVIPLDPPGPYERDDHNRAFRRTILQSAWSDSIFLLTDQDSVPPPAPSVPNVTEFLGTLKVPWDGLDAAGLPMPPDFAAVEVHLSTVSNFEPDETTYRETLFGPSHTVITDLLYNVGYFARLVAVDLAGNRSAPSGQGAGYTRQLLEEDIFAGAVGEAQLAYAAVTTAKIKDLAVNDAKIANLSVGKLTTGQLLADMILAAKIKTAETGARIEFDGTSFRQYNAANQLRTQFVGATGEALITGLIRSALTGERFELNPNGTLRVYPMAGSNYAAMFNVGNELVFRGQLRTSDNAAAYVRLNSNAVAVQYGLPDLSRVYAQLTVQQSNVDMTSPLNGMRSDKRYATASGQDHSNVFLFNDSNGSDISGSVVNHLEWNSQSTAWAFPGRNVNLIGTTGLSTHRFVLAYNDTKNADLQCGNVYAPNVVAPSGVAVKEQITEVAYEPLEVVRGAPAREWQYRPETFEGPQREGSATHKLRHRKPGTDPRTQDERDFELVDPPEIDTSQQSQMLTVRRIGPMADDIEAVAPELITVDETGKLTLSPIDLVGVLWKAVEQLAAKVDALTDKHPDIPELPGRKIKPKLPAPRDKRPRRTKPNQLQAPRNGSESP